MVLVVVVLIVILIMMRVDFIVVSFYGGIGFLIVVSVVFDLV